MDQFQGQRGPIRSAPTVRQNNAMELKVKIWLERDGELAFGPGRAQLLEAIAETGSISAAASALEMSYRHAWSMIRASERRLGSPLVQTHRGGKGGGGAGLTEFAGELLERFREMEADFEALRERQSLPIREG